VHRGDVSPYFLTSIHVAGSMTKTRCRLRFFVYVKPLKTPTLLHSFITSLNISRTFSSLKHSLFLLNHCDPSKPNCSKVCSLLYDHPCFMILMLITCYNCSGTVYVLCTLHFTLLARAFFALLSFEFLRRTNPFSKLCLFLPFSINFCSFSSRDGSNKNTPNPPPFITTNLYIVGLLRAF